MPIVGMLLPRNMCPAPIGGKSREAHVSTLPSSQPRLKPLTSITHKSIDLCARMTTPPWVLALCADGAHDPPADADLTPLMTMTDATKEGVPGHVPERRGGGGGTSASLSRSIWSMSFSIYCEFDTGNDVRRAVVLSEGMPVHFQYLHFYPHTFKTWMWFFPPVQSHSSREIGFSSTLEGTRTLLRRFHIR